MGHFAAVVIAPTVVLNCTSHIRFSLVSFVFTTWLLVVASFSLVIFAYTHMVGLHCPFTSYTMFGYFAFVCTSSSLVFGGSTHFYTHFSFVCSLHFGWFLCLVLIGQLHTHTHSPFHTGYIWTVIKKRLRTPHTAMHMHAATHTTRLHTPHTPAHTRTTLHHTHTTTFRTHTTHTHRYTRSVVEFYAIFHVGLDGYLLHARRLLFAFGFILPHTFVG